MPSVNEQAIMRRVAWRLVPLLGIGYFVNALDRSNVAVAALTMNKALGFTAAEYGLGAGAFFWSYVLFQVPATSSWLAWAPAVGSQPLCSPGPLFGRDGPGDRREQLRRRPLPLGRRRGRLFLRRDLLHDALVPRPLPLPRHRHVLRLRRPRRVHRCADIGDILALHGWMGLQGWQWIFLIEATPGSPRRHLPLRAVRSASRCAMAGARGKAMAARQARHRTARGGRP